MNVGSFVILIDKTAPRSPLKFELLNYDPRFLDLKRFIIDAGMVPPGVAITPVNAYNLLRNFKPEHFQKLSDDGKMVWARQAPNEALYIPAGCVVEVICSFPLTGQDSPNILDVTKVSESEALKVHSLSFAGLQPQADTTRPSTSLWFVSP